MSPGRRRPPVSDSKPPARGRPAAIAGAALGIVGGEVGLQGGLGRLEQVPQVVVHEAVPLGIARAVVRQRVRMQALARAGGVAPIEDRADLAQAVRDRGVDAREHQPALVEGADLQHRRYAARSSVASSWQPCSSRR